MVVVIVSPTAGDAIVNTAVACVSAAAVTEEPMPAAGSAAHAITDDPPGEFTID